MLRKILFISALISLVTVGCKKDFLDQNVDPNNPAVVPAAEILPAALDKTALLMVDGNLIFPNIWMGYWAFSSTYGIPSDQRNYQYPTSSTAQGYFSDAYSNASDYNQIINLGKAQNNFALQGIGRIMKSMVMQTLVDLYGDVPYSQAFQGLANQTPKYDKASDIYDSLYNQLSVAINNLNTAGTSDFPSSSSDLLFQGNKAMWIKFANTLKLKLLIRQAAYAPKAAYIQAKLADFNNDLSVFLQAGDIAQINPGYTNSANKQNPFWSNFGYSVTNIITPGSNCDFYKGGINAINFFSAQNDLRLVRIMDYTSFDAGSGPALADPAFWNNIKFSALGVYFNFAGAEMGTAPVAAPGTVLPTFSNIASAPTTSNLLPVKKATSSALIFSDFESLFLQAEAVQRNWFSTGVAQDLFNSAVTQSFAYDLDPAIAALGGPASGGAAAFVQPDVIPTQDNDWATAQSTGIDPIQLIITQKWMALGTYNLLEPWTEYRRTGFPKVPISSSAGSNPIPYRYLYPQREFSVNGANVPAIGAGDQFKQKGKIFWMP